jgi:hypothetical protein
MKIYQKTWLVLAAFLAAPAMGPAGAQAALSGNASDVEMKIYEMYVSAHADCSSPIRIFSNPGAAAQNVVASPTFGIGAIPNGTYQCIIVKMSDEIAITPAFTSDGNLCKPSITIPLDVCGAGKTYTDALSGAALPCTAGDDTVYAYFTTAPSGDNSCLTRNNGCLLASAFTVTGDRTMTFVANFDGKVEERFGQCDCQPPVFSVR